MGFFLLGLVALVFVRDASSLKDVHLNIPSAVIRGHSAFLRCHYDLEGDQLYTVKWYKGRREFYRYTPKELPPKKMFPIPGVEVREDFSNGTHLNIENVGDDSSGEYNCEISADAPSFFTKIVTGFLNVVDLPKTDPSINGLKTRYRLGEILDANCTSSESNPPANLTWYINGARLNDGHTGKRIRRHRYRLTSREAFPKSAYTKLRLPVTKQLFQKRRLKIRCTATIYDVYYRSSEKGVELEKKHHPVKHQKIADDRWNEIYPVATSVYPLNSVKYEYETQAVQKHSNMSLTFAQMNGKAGLSSAFFNCLFLYSIIFHLR